MSSLNARVTDWISSHLTRCEDRRSSRSRRLNGLCGAEGLTTMVWDGTEPECRRKYNPTPRALFLDATSLHVSDTRLNLPPWYPRKTSLRRSEALFPEPRKSSSSTSPATSWSSTMPPKMKTSCRSPATSSTPPSAPRPARQSAAISRGSLRASPTCSRSR